MSLRDQLVAKGIASKKDAKKIDRVLKEERRAEQGSRKSKSELAAEQEALRREAEQQLDQQRAQRAARDEEEREALRVNQARDIIVGNRQQPGRGQPFWHRAMVNPSQGNARLVRIEVSSGVAFQLRCGDAAIAALPRRTPVSLDDTHDAHDAHDYVIIPKTAAVRLLEIAPEQVVFFVTDTAGISEPENRFLQRKWETSLSPHRDRRPNR